MERHIRANAGRIFEDVDFHDLSIMLRQGMSEGEIAKELGVSHKVVQWIRREIEKDV